MRLARLATESGPRWTADGLALTSTPSLSLLLSMEREQMLSYLETAREAVTGSMLAPLEDAHEVWAAGVTYLRSRIEREAESSVADVYARVYDAARPELFFKSIGSRVVGPNGTIRIRRDSDWNVPEPELTLVVNRHLEIVGYTAGNDVSSRSIEGENPLYLPQAKMYDGSCALGSEILLATEDEMSDLPVHLSVIRKDVEVFAGDARTSQMKRTLRDLVDYLGREYAFPNGAFLMTGAGIVPTADFTLTIGDEVQINVGEVSLTNTVA